MHELMVRDDIYSAIEQAYGSFDEPKWGFVHEALQARPYERLLGQLKRFGEIREDIDTNYDVSFGYALGTRWVLRLSMVGPYVVLLRREDGGWVPITSRHGDLTPDETELIQVLEREGIEVLDRAILELPARVRLELAEGAHARLYHALFTDDYWLPWQPSERAS
jgi:hypothetical protein